MYIYIYVYVYIYICSKKTYVISKWYQYHLYIYRSSVTMISISSKGSPNLLLYQLYIPTFLASIPIFNLYQSTKALLMVKPWLILWLSLQNNPGLKKKCDETHQWVARSRENASSRPSWRSLNLCPADCTDRSVELVAAKICDRKSNRKMATL